MTDIIVLTHLTMMYNIIAQLMTREIHVNIIIRKSKTVIVYFCFEWSKYDHIF
jgi:hypothetical protein